MRRAIPVIVVALAALVLVPAPASAAVDNGGCPPVASNWTLATDSYAAMLEELDEAVAAGFTLEQVLAFEGAESIQDAYDNVWLPIWTSVDKNGDEALCIATRWGVEKKYPWGAFVLDNVLPH